MSHSGLLTGDVAIVTGAGRNIGQAIAERFAAEGASVVVADIDGDRAEETAATIRDDDGDAVAVQADVSSEADAEAMVQATEEAFGGVEGDAANRIGRAAGLHSLVDPADRHHQRNGHGR